ncbi:prepilin-type N-terminal cleavage/methylation domain-containing protein [Vibrio hannami]|uniref:pilus assembly FimT family protein n=1 Tax=Vibrio hannami TaxID=2717094 RepID=UPI00241025B4|nr:prepilin-type N-terminal cleavage/methylation domain-containing protein [Vibrio hannami]MDG3087301.1 prepilin-type N-terminal cleavage/methylation domain-containing protein [Vibrio hannami]
MEIVRGFTLIELVVVLLIFSVAFTGLSVGFESLFEQLRMRRIAAEISSFFFNVRSETMHRGEELYVVVNSSPLGDLSWTLELRSEKQSEAIQIVEGRYTQIQVSGSQNKNGPAFIYMDHISAKYRGNGHLLIRYQNNPVKPLKLVYYGITGRTKICGEGGEFYGFPKC